MENTRRLQSHRYPPTRLQLATSRLPRSHPCTPPTHPSCYTSSSLEQPPNQPCTPPSSSPPPTSPSSPNPLLPPDPHLPFLLNPTPTPTLPNLRFPDLQPITPPITLPRKQIKTPVMFRTGNSRAQLDPKVLDVEGCAVAERERGVGAFLRKVSEPEKVEYKNHQDGHGKQQDPRTEAGLCATAPSSQKRQRRNDKDARTNQVQN